MNDERLGVALVLVSAAGFGTLGVFGKLAAGAGLPIPTVLTARFLLATLLVWTVLLVRGEASLLRGRDLAVALGLGAFGYAAMSGLYFLGLEFMTAGLVGIVLYTYPAFVVLIAVLALDERVTRRTAVALILSLGGVALITGANPAAADPRGVVIVLGAAVVYASYITVSREALGRVEARTLTAHVLPAAGVVYVAIGAATGSLVVPDAEGWLVLAAIAVLATALPIFTFFAGIARIGASRGSIVSTVEPVFTVALGAVVLGEAVTPAVVAGGLLVLAGVVVLER